MRVIDAESQLIKEVADEMVTVESREHKDFKVYVGRHPMLGHLALVVGRDGSGVIVEME